MDGTTPIGSRDSLISPQSATAVNHNTPTSCPPFLKWAGGKRWLTDAHSSIFPSTYESYFEPFLGGGAVFFFLKPKKAVLSDINDELINAYLAVKQYPHALEEKLKLHQKKHCKAYYYQIREMQPADILDRAARTLYLNRTCWNGLYRVNKNGLFNVPIGTKDTVIDINSGLIQPSKVLANSQIKAQHFSISINQAKCNDFVFADPPYTVTHNRNGFIKYNQNIFSWEDQERLAHDLIEARKRGVKVLATNAHHESVIDLYKDHFEVISLERKSVISGKRSGRGNYLEILIKGY